jgi:hypothetical protein
MMSTKKTGWEDLDKWVPASPASEGDAVASGPKTTGWEALDKWVGDSPASGAAADSAPAGAKTTGWEALDKWVGDDGASAGSGAGTTGQAVPRRGFMGWLKGLFGGK